LRIEETCGDNFIKNINISIAAAGTGGHINPGIAVAESLQKKRIHNLMAWNTKRNGK